MQHHFNIDHARKYGVNEAILINNFVFWIAKNKANDRHIHDGRTWTYNSKKAMTALFPYWTEKQIRRAISNLIDANVLVTANLNENPYNRTLWYAFVDEEQFLNGKSDLTKRSNRLDQTVKCNGPNGQISNGTDNKPYDSTPHNPPGGGKKASKICLPDLPEPLQRGRIPEAWEQFLNHRREMKKPVTKTSAYRIFSDLYEWQQTYGTDFAAKSLENSVRNGWQGVFMPDFSQYRKPNGSANIHPMTRLKFIEEQIESHPANRNSINHDEDCGEDKRQEFRKLKETRDQLKAEIAHGQVATP